MGTPVRLWLGASASQTSAFTGEAVLGVTAFVEETPWSAND